ncbi:hypothetical protein [Haloferula helveola]
MKGPLIAAFSLIALLGGSVYLIPRWVAASRARPLYGNFDIGLRCMGGHEIFLFLAETRAYDNCPGHRSLDSPAEVIRTETSVTILNSRDQTPRLRIDYDGSRHTITSIERGWTEDLPQVSNPWRTWLPKILPE